MAKAARSDHGREEAGHFAYDRLDRAMHERARLGIMTSLVTHPHGLSFSDLKVLCNLTDGNLKRHLDVLEDEQLITLEKEQAGARSQTVCRLTPSGKKRFLSYLEELERVVSDASSAVQTESASARTRWATGH